MELLLDCFLDVPVAHDGLFDNELGHPVFVKLLLPKKIFFVFKFGV